MGIKGLHGLLKSIQKPVHLRDFSGQTLGVDAYGWLHRGTIACSIDLVLDRPTTKHIDFVLNRVRMLLYFGVRPYLIFDGDDLPSKAGTEAQRQQRRQESKALGLDLKRKGKIAEAYQELQKAVDVTPYMARQLIEELKKMDVQYVVAPYEADAQMVYLEREGIINGIISEDSDLLVFGAKRLLSKLDQHGDCIEINRANFSACREVSLAGWTDDDFRRMCILSGCDYLPNIPKMGLKTAYRSIRKYKDVEKALRMLKFEGHFRVPADYLQNFAQAERTFLYQRVFCPKAGKLVTLTPLDTSIELEELTFIGDDVEPEIAVQVARGDLDPMSKEPIVLKPINPQKVPSGIVRRQTLGSSADLKPSKPISSFFTPKRTPLAELDPNSLSPSPSQQRLLQRHASSSWEASPAPVRPSLLRSATSFTPRSSPLVRSAERDSFLAQASRVSTVQPVKRQRLCFETEEEAVPSRPVNKSPFFAATTEEASPSGQKMLRGKKSRKSCLDVFSDDQAAEDIMSQLTDPVKPDNKAMKISERSNVSRPDSQKQEEQELASAMESDPHGSDKGASVPPVASCKTVSIDSDPKLFHQVLGYHVKKQNTALLAKYAFQSPAANTAPSTITWGAQEGSPKRQRLTPLQRLGQTALSRSRSLNLPRTKAVVRTASDPSQMAPMRLVSTPLNRGSEDMIIPDSEEEAEEDCSPTTNARRGTLDLKRFSFVPQ
ncbi:hypothetical protein ASPZODRAFT_1652967 [Penicilliopsis zonata CBS 506.65]|uniref:Uncharacterized protein n=1 Tax=Penicilliopsis zonata CBS 506.65 TaxID=1073090 RepID=A0A1L9SN19_9EURO|nr:hypothetical protein ASPZODRAFT_1652967 [Penicilliopsis zonata CBS 506.65]OJJ48662.1 hypothetical protein ASPZODRAFT_1652967 [Penicilliopsis zonata CBS 506.65]